jgi:AAA+ superfamily predicted ATPase
MKTLNDFVIEKLNLNSESKIRKPIPTKFSDDFLFTDKEIDIIQSYMYQMKIRPCILTNYILVNGTLSDYSNNVFIYFNENWHKEHPSNYLFITKNPNNSKMTVTIINNFYINTIYDNKDLKIACNIILNNLDENDEFYDEVKNN